MILAYHQIVTEECRYLYSVEAGLFRQHMALIHSIEGKHAVTFDDGYLSHYHLARPLLEKHSMTGWFFITPEWVGQSGYMGWQEIKELHRNGHQIGSHGWSHRMLTECGAAELQGEVRRSRQVLEERLGLPIQIISCPGGAWNRTVARACADAGYSRMYTSDPWAGCRRVGGIEVSGRLIVRRTWTPRDLKQLISAEQKPYSAVRLGFAVTRAARRVLGVRVYHAIWCRLAGWSPDDNLEGSRVAGKCGFSN